MKIILSPAKKMKMEQEAETLTTPVFMENYKRIDVLDAKADL